MAVTLEQATAYVQGATSDVASLLVTANDLIAARIGTAQVPDSVLDNATLQLVQELHYRQKARGGYISEWGSDSPLRLPRDPMTPIMPLLSPWLVGIA